MSPAAVAAPQPRRLLRATCALPSCRKPLARARRGRPKEYCDKTCQRRARTAREALVRSIEQATAALRELDRGPVPILDPDLEHGVTEAVALLRTLALSDPAAPWAVSASALAARLEPHLG